MGGNNLTPSCRPASGWARLRSVRGRRAWSWTSSAAVYVLNKFDASISTVNIETATYIRDRPHGVLRPDARGDQDGRPFLRRHRTSGGRDCCAACLDARTDQLARRSTRVQPSISESAGRPARFSPHEGTKPRRRLNIGTEPFLARRPHGHRGVQRRVRRAARRRSPAHGR